MSTVRVLVGTRKGAFILTSDGKRENWDVSGPHFAGWEIYHLKGSPADPNRLYASQIQRLVRPDDPALERWRQNLGDPGGGMTTGPGGMPSARAINLSTTRRPKPASPTTHQWYDGTQHPWEFKRVWHLEPSLDDPDTVYAGVEDAAIFRSTDGGQSWHELSGLRGHGTGPSWQPGAGGMCLHTILLDPSNPERMFIAISAAGAFRTDDGGKTWKPINRGLEVAIHSRSHRRSRPLRSPHRHAPLAPGCAVHAEALGRDAQRQRRRHPGTKSAAICPPISAFAIDVHAHEPETIYVVPIKSDSEHYPPDGKLRVYRSRTGGNEWEAAHQRPAAKQLLRECVARRDGRRFARFVRRLFRHHGRAGVRIGRRRRQLGAHRPRSSGGALRRGADAAMIRVVLPAHLRTLAHVGRRSEARRAGRSRSARFSMRSKHAIRCCAVPFAITSPSSGAPSCVSSPVKKICRLNRPTLLFPTPSPPAKNHFSSLEQSRAVKKQESPCSFRATIDSRNTRTI